MIKSNDKKQSQAYKLSQLSWYHFNQCKYRVGFLDMNSVNNIIENLDRSLELALKKNFGRGIDFFQLEGKQMPSNAGSWKISIFLIHENNPKGRHQVTLGEGDFLLNDLRPAIESWFQKLNEKHSTLSAPVVIFIDPY